MARIAENFYILIGTPQVGVKKIPQEVNFFGRKVITIWADNDEEAKEEAKKMPYNGQRLFRHIV